jgi:hypothetical protein
MTQVLFLSSMVLDSIEEVNLFAQSEPTVPLVRIICPIAMG